jgi:hypothetical protein
MMMSPWLLLPLLLLAGLVVSAAALASDSSPERLLEVKCY